MIRVEFDGRTNIPGSLLLTAADLIEPGVLVQNLQEGADGLSRHLQKQFSTQTKELLAQHVVGDPVSEELRDRLIDDLNTQLQGPCLYVRGRFSRADLDRKTLTDPLIEQQLTGENLVRLNRLLLEDIYPELIAKSARVEWDAWIFLAEGATAEVIKQWEDWKVAMANSERTGTGGPPEFEPAWRTDVWKGIRDWLLKYIFHGKCAYCETTEVGYIADAEHFRPKGQVRTQSGIVKTFDIDGATEITHPGYFWLAYRWENLLPSCNTCNRYGGKKDLFPVGNAHLAVKRITDDGELTRLRHQQRRSMRIDGVYYLEPDDLDQFEDRLLLHPYFDHPEQHVRFKLDGRAEPRPGSKQGQPSIDVFNLNESNKVAQRSRIQGDDAIVYVSKVSAAIPDRERMKSVAREIANQYFNGVRPYAAAVFDSIRVFTGDGLLSPDVLLKDTPDSK